MNGKKSRLAFWGHFITSLAVIAMFLTFAASASAEKSGKIRKIVMFKKNFSNVEAQKGLLRAFGLEGEGLLPLGLINGMAVTLPEQAVKALADADEVLLIEDDVRIYAAGISGRAVEGNNGKVKSSSQELPFGVDRIDAEMAWPTTGAGVNVAVLDTGIDRNHRDLAVAGGINFVGRSPLKKAPRGKWNDDSVIGHGTHVAGIIGALDNAIGVVGVAPDVSLYAVKVMDSLGEGYVSDLIAGIEWAVENNMHLVNMSLGVEKDLESPELQLKVLQPLHNACEAARAAGVILVAAAGNEGPEDDTVGYPASYASVIAVAAVDENIEVAGYSSRGLELDIAGPGAFINSTNNRGYYSRLSGTSVAAPHVTGALALRISEDLLLAEGMGDLEYYRGLLCDTAEDIGALEGDAGCGLVDALSLVTE